jgi:cell division protein FtsL
MNDFATPVHMLNKTKILQRQRIFKNLKIRTLHVRKALLVPGLLFLLVMSLLFYVWTRVKVVQYGYEISAALKAREEAMLARNERTIEIATLRSAQRVEKRAREELKMNAPRKDQLVIIR